MTGPASLAGLLEPIPDAAIAELSRWFPSRAEQIGGRMIIAGRPVRLTGRATNRRSRTTVTTVTLAGTPTSAWSLKSYGRRGGYTVKPRRHEALRLSGRANVFFEEVHIKRPARGDRRWERLVDETEAAFADIVVAQIERAL